MKCEHKAKMEVSKETLEIQKTENNRRNRITTQVCYGDLSRLAKEG